MLKLIVLPTPTDLNYCPDSQGLAGRPPIGIPFKKATALFVSRFS